MDCDECKLKNKCTGMPCLCFQAKWRESATGIIGIILVTALVFYFYYQF
jgi:hypothetical protein